MTHLIITALPFHIYAETDTELILTRGATTLKINGPHVYDILKHICEQIGNCSLSKEALMNTIPEDLRDDAINIVDTLIERRLFVESNNANIFVPDLESPIDLFHWQFSLTTLQPDINYQKAHLVVVGINNISETLIQAVESAGFTNINVLDDPFLRGRSVEYATIKKYNVINEITDWISSELKDDCIIIVCSDGGSEAILREWNVVCVKKGLRFLPILLRNMVGFVGPLVLPGETACFECKTRREAQAVSWGRYDENAANIESERSLLSAFHPSMSSILAHIATMELVKFLGEIPVFSAGMLFDVNLLRPELVSRRILKLPNCPVCSSINSVPIPSVVNITRDS
jgi:molybdopterin-synthase adenylyltransferase